MSDRPWYKRYPSDFIAGTISLNLEEAGAYSYIIDLIQDIGAPIPDEKRWLSRVMGCSLQRWSKVRQSLIDKNKIQIIDGKILEKRAIKESESYNKVERKLDKSLNKVETKFKVFSSKSLETLDTPLTEARSQNPDKKYIKKFDMELIKKWARETGITVSVETEYDKYLDWKKSKGRNHKDNEAGFRNWLRKAQEFSGEGLLKTKKQSDESKKVTKINQDSSLRSDIKIAIQNSVRNKYDCKPLLAEIAKDINRDIKDVEKIAKEFMQ